MDQVNGDEAGRYACGDVESTLMLADQLAPRIASNGMDDLLYGEELALIPVLVDMERTGIAVDTGLSHHVLRRADLTAGPAGDGYRGGCRAGRQYRLPQAARRAAVRRTGTPVGPADEDRFLG